MKRPGFRILNHAQNFFSSNFRLEIIKILGKTSVCEAVQLVLLFVSRNLRCFLKYILTGPELEGRPGPMCMTHSTWPSTYFHRECNHPRPQDRSIHS